VRIEGENGLLPVIAFLMNLRSRATGIATGDQAIFVRRDAFERAGRFPSLELMEDIALSRSLKRVSRPLCLADKAVTSGRRWECHGSCAPFYSWVAAPRVFLRCGSREAGPPL